MSWETYHVMHSVLDSHIGWRGPSTLGVSTLDKGVMEQPQNRIMRLSSATHSHTKNKTVESL